MLRLESRKYDPFTPILQSLHWLPTKFRISSKILLLAYKALNDLAPAYRTNLLSRYNPTRSLRQCCQIRLTISSPKAHQTGPLQQKPALNLNCQNNVIEYYWHVNQG